MIWLVVCVLLFLRTCVLVMSMVSFRGMLMYRSYYVECFIILRCGIPVVC